MVGFFALFSVSGCGDTVNDASLHVTIEVRNQYDDEAWIEVKPFHYKYSEKKRWPIGKGASVKMNFRADIPEDTWLVLRLGGRDYELPKVKKGTIQIDADAGAKPALQGVVIDGEPIRPFARWLTDDQAFVDSLRVLQPKFLAGDIAASKAMAWKRYEFAQRVFDGTNLNHIPHRLLGEYLIRSLEGLYYQRNNPDFDLIGERRNVLRETRQYSFFTMPILMAQRAGSRDFTHHYSRTYIDFEALRRELGTGLSAHSLQQIAYSKLDSARQSIVKRIRDDDARVYTDLHLAAERLGDAPFAAAEPHYLRWMEMHAKTYPDWATFLKTHYEAVKRVSPGSPALPFEIEDVNGKSVRLHDFKGKYVLLDFWANWCGPCLEEFPEMRRLYAKYPRESFEIIGISVDLDRREWAESLTRHGNAWVQLWGGKQFEQETFMAYRGGGIPFYVLIDPDGNIARYNDIRATYNLEHVLDSLLTPRPFSMGMAWRF